MKAILEFELPQEKSEFEDASKGLDYYCVLTEFQESLRRARKNSDYESVTFDEVFLMLSDSLDAYDVKLDK